MPVITLIALVDTLGGTLPARARLTATASRARVDGATLTLPKRVTVDIIAGLPSVPLDLAPSANDWGWALSLVDLVNPGLGVDRFVIVPDVAGPIDWGDLVDVDPASLDPTADPEAAWWLEILTQVDGAHLSGYNLVLEQRNGNEINVGDVRGPIGGTGPQGNPGDAGVVTTNAAALGTLDLSGMVFGDIKRIALTGHVTAITLPTPAAAVGGTLTVYITESNGGGWAITWPAGVKWADGLAPVIFSTSGAISIVHLLWVGNGWFGLYAGGNFA